MSEAGIFERHNTAFRSKRFILKKISFCIFSSHAFFVFFSRYHIDVTGLTTYTRRPLGTSCLGTRLHAFPMPRKRIFHDAFGGFLVAAIDMHVIDNDAR